MPEVVEQQKEAIAPPIVQKGRYEIPVFADEKPKAEAPAAPAPAAPSTPAAAEAPATPESQNTGEQATPAEDPEGEKQEKELTPEQAEKRKEGRRFERKLGKAYKERAEAQARAEILEKQLADERARSAPKAPESEPRLEQFDYDPEKYAAAKADWKAKQERQAWETEQRTQVGKQAQAKLLADWEERAELGAEKYADWSEKVGDLKPINPLISAIMGAENGHDIAHHLGTHKKEALRIAELPPLQQVFEIGKLAMKLSVEPDKPKAPSKAPAPITPLKGTAPIVSSPVEDPSADMEQWVKARRKQVYGKS